MASIKNRGSKAGTGASSSSNNVKNVIRRRYTTPTGKPLSAFNMGRMSRHS